MSVVRLWLWLFLPPASVAGLVAWRLNDLAVAAFGHVGAGVLGLAIGILIGAIWLVVTWRRVPRWVA